MRIPRLEKDYVPGSEKTVKINETNEDTKEITDSANQFLRAMILEHTID